MQWQHCSRENRPGAHTRKQSKIQSFLSKEVTNVQYVLHPVIVMNMQSINRIIKDKHEVITIAYSSTGDKDLNERTAVALFE